MHETKIRNTMIATAVALASTGFPPGAAGVEDNDHPVMLEGLEQMQDDVLSDARGRNIQEGADVDVVQLSKSQQTGTSTDNSIGDGDQTFSGHLVEEGAISDNRGNLVLFLNSGNFNVLQNTTIYNITLFED